MPTQYKLLAIALMLVAAFGSGVTVSNWHHDAVELAAQKAADKVADKFQGDQKEIAQNVVTSLDLWRKNNVIVQESITREKLQPIFAVQCVTPEYVRMFNLETTQPASRPSQSSAKAGN